MNRIALVTGANRGVGLEVCRQIALLGMEVILASRDAEKGRAAAAQLAANGVRVEPMQLDVRDEASIARLHADILSRYGRLDVLVNNAAVMPDSGIRLLDIPPDMMRGSWDTNTFGPLRLCQTFIPLMLQHNYGRVINVSSQKGQMESMAGGSGAYRVSKAALNAVTAVLAAEVQGTNVKVNSMSPGWVRTDMGGPNATGSVEEGADTVIWLATLPDDGPSGGFFKKRQRLAW